MSFGISVGDFLTVSALTWQVYKSCKDAPRTFKNISSDVLSLHAVLTEVEEVLIAQPLTLNQQLRLQTVSQGCQAVLSDLQAIVRKYESLGARNKRIRDRMEWNWNSREISELQSRLTTNMVLLSTFVSAAKASTEWNREGKGESPVILLQVDDDTLRIEDKGEQTSQICREMKDTGITAVDFDFDTHENSTINQSKGDPLVDDDDDDDDDDFGPSQLRTEKSPSFEPVIGDPWMKIEELTLSIGNTYRELAPELRKSDICRHAWMFFVRPSRTDIIQEVKFLLNALLRYIREQKDPTFDPQTVVCTRPPYQVSRMGWGFFTIRAAIALKPGYCWKSDDTIYIVDDPNRRALFLEWTLNFDVPRSSENRTFLIET